MTDTINRRNLLSGLATGGTVALAGCTDEPLRVANVESDVEMDVRIDHGVLRAAALVVQFERAPDFDAVALVSPFGDQLQARGLGTGERMVSLPINSLRPGVWRLIGVRGGEMGCYAGDCAISGGEIVLSANVKLE